MDCTLSKYRRFSAAEVAGIDINLTINMSQFKRLKAGSASEIYPRHRHHVPTSCTPNCFPLCTLARASIPILADDHDKPKFQPRCWTGCWRVWTGCLRAWTGCWTGGRTGCWTGCWIECFWIGRFSSEEPSHECSGPLRMISCWHPLHQAYVQSSMGQFNFRALLNPSLSK